VIPRKIKILQQVLKILLGGSREKLWIQISNWMNQVSLIYNTSRLIFTTNLDFHELYEAISPNAEVSIRGYSYTDADLLLLEELQPDWVVMYDADIAFVRRLEARELIYIHTLMDTSKYQNRFTMLLVKNPKS
jgi:hypothetical protein